jgi:hypothetical protein
MEAVFMVAVIRKLATLRKTLDKPPLTEEQAREIYRQGEAAVVFSLLTLSERLAATQPNATSPTTPSGMTPPYQKPAKSSGRKRPGRKPGHPGSRRPPPDHIDRQESHRLACCPICSGPLNRCTATRKRFTEDIPEGIKPVVVEHTIHRDWCPTCRKMVEPVVPDALPHASLGNRTLAMTSWLHYGLGNSLAQIVDVFNFHFQLKLTPSGLVQSWQRMQAVLYPYQKGGEHWPAFAKKLRRLIGDAIRLWRKKSETPEATYASRRALLHERLREMLETD